MKKRIFTSVLLIISCFHSLAWQRHQQSVHLGAGGNAYITDGGFDGCGTIINAGWQKTDKSGQGHFSPDLAISFNSNDCAEDIRNATYTSISLRAIYNYDFIQTNRFAAFIGGGGLTNFTSGSVAPLIISGDFQPGETRNDFNLGFAANIGIRFSPKGRRMGFELVPINVQVGIENYTELFIMGRLFYSLDGRRSKKSTTQ